MILAITAAAEPTRDAIVFGAPPSTLALLAGSDTRVVGIGDSYLVVRGAERGFVRALYANGAWIVLPARTGGCLGTGKQSS